MSQLLSQASPWNSEESAKKKPAMPNFRKTLKKVHFSEDFPKSQLEQFETIHGAQKIIEKMNAVQMDDDGQSLANFNPIARPEITYEKQDVPTYASYPTEPGSSYGTVYNPPYFAKPPDANIALTEKLNYMIHLLEQQQHEQTENVTEEFFLYIFLGLFIIYIVDSFTKTGRYIR